MAQELSDDDAMALVGRSRQDGAVYPWDMWANGGWWLLTEGEDYTVTLAAVRSSAYGYARRSGRRAETVTVAGGMLVRFTDR
jgi:hypothetical protein